MNVFDFALINIPLLIDNQYVNNKTISNSASSALITEHNINRKYFPDNIPTPQRILLSTLKNNFTNFYVSREKYISSKKSYVNYKFNLQYVDENDAFHTNNDLPSHASFPNITARFEFGKITGISGSAQFKWHSHGVLCRDNAPASIIFSDFSLEVENGNIFKTEVKNVSISWPRFNGAIIKPELAGKIIPDSIIMDYISEKEISVDYTSTDKFFASELDELAFLVG